MAAKGVKTRRGRYYQGKMKRVGKFLTDDGRAETPDFAAEMKLREAERVREDAFQRLKAAEDDGEVSFKQAQLFFERDYKDEVKDFLDDKRTAEQFRAAVNMKLDRVIEPVKQMGSDEKNPFFEGGKDA